MAKYTPSYLDVSGFSRAISDQLIRSAQINLRREQIVDNNIDQYLRMYTGKIRPQDMNKFTEKFNEFANVSKGFMKVNRTGAPGQSITNLSMARDMTKKQMMDFSDKSRAVGEMQKTMSGYKNNVRDTEQYLSVMSDLSSMDVDELEQKYGGIDKIPTRFEFKKEKFNIGGLQSSIKALQATRPKSPVKSTPVLNTDGTEKMEMESYEVSDDKGIKKQVNIPVPLKEIDLSVDPTSVRQIVGTVSMSDFRNKDFFNSYKDDVFKLASSQQDPVMSQQNSELINLAMSKYGKSNPEDLSGEDLYSAFLVKNSDLGKVVVKDYDRLDDMYKMWARQNNISVADARLKALNEQKGRALKNDRIRAINAVMNTFRTSTNLGLWGLDGTGDMLIDLINEVFPGFVTKESLKDALQNKRDIVNEEAEVISNLNYPKQKQ